MCGRFTLSVDAPTLKRHLGTHYCVDDLDSSHTPRYNIAPSQIVLTIIRHNGTHRVGEIAWGLVGLHSSHKPLINARSEDVAEKPTFKSSVARRRCLVLSNGFYEWDREKSPYHITPGGGVFAFAPIYSKPTTKHAAGVAILTRFASEAMADIHSRMPVMLTPDAAKAYLRGEGTPDGRASLNDTPDIFSK